MAQDHTENSRRNTLLYPSSASFESSARMIDCVSVYSTDRTLTAPFSRFESMAAEIAQRERIKLKKR